ncbi:YhgE/Pip domain-containing protein [Gracilibacillus oryzae]|uniref:YhgE/Pip domain-containing protein n=1 Tax=Gracilibacillus oryzae TaxID=1672701 RepID=A0A7C8GX43_9BACI|nr:YhgE/Pip domain-containing protein [Gracilibacillus oryzae]KAB8139364.1 YhgE/Pip domain-containing protein [Gracilibacillus oryzae]
MRSKTIFVVLLTIVLIFPSLFLNAALNEDAAKDSGGNAANGEYKSKDEVIYATLSATGEKEALYVVNRFEVTEPGQIIDYGPYKNVKNLTDTEEMEQTDQKVSFEASEGEFYYQGNLENQSLPWDVSITYTLDGKQTEPQDLLGQDGKLEITINTTKNENVDPVFYQNYLLQVSLTLDPTIYNNISAPNATIANAGKNKQISYTVMPENNGNLTLSADVTDFELNGIEISAVPSSMSIETPDVGEMTGEIETLSDAVNEINSGVAQLEDGIKELNTGVAGLADGSQQYSNGISEVNQSSTELVNASNSIKDALTKMNQSLKGESGEMDLSQLTQLPEGLSEIGSGLNETAAGLMTLQKNYVSAFNALNQAMEQIPENNITEEQMNALYNSGANSDVVDQLIETYKAALTVKQTYENVKEGFLAVEETLNSVNGTLTTMSGSINTMAENISNSLAKMDTAGSLEQLQAGIAGLSENYQQFHGGLVNYTNGISQLANNYSELNGGIAELSNGTSELANGAGELHNGTSELADATSDMPEQIQTEVDQMMDEYDKSDFDPVSFVSDKNDKVKTVQFVIKTESIVKEEEKTEEVEEEEEQGFWSRLVNLFS